MLPIFLREDSASTGRYLWIHILEHIRTTAQPAREISLACDNRLRIAAREFRREGAESHWT
jgi:hypothetical protein